MTRKAKRSAHAELDELRQRGAAECAKARELETGLEAAKMDVETAAAGVTDAYTVEDAKLIAQRRKDLEAAEAKVLDLQHRVGGAEIRVEQAQRNLDDFHRESARELLDEREAEARALAADLTRAAQGGCSATPLLRRHADGGRQARRGDPGCRPPLGRGARRAPLGTRAARPGPGDPGHTRTPRPIAALGGASRTAAGRTTPTGS